MTNLINRDCGDDRYLVLDPDAWGYGAVLALRQFWSRGPAPGQCLLHLQRHGIEMLSVTTTMEVTIDLGPQEPLLEAITTGDQRVAAKPVGLAAHLANERLLPMDPLPRGCAIWWLKWIAERWH